jgi:hypothetical protein
MSDYTKEETRAIIPRQFDGEDLSPTHAISQGLHDGLRTLIQYGFALTLGAVVARVAMGKKANTLLERI